MRNVHLSDQRVPKTTQSGPADKLNRLIFHFQLPPSKCADLAERTEPTVSALFIVDGSIPVILIA